MAIHTFEKDCLPFEDYLNKQKRGFFLGVELTGSAKQPLKKTSERPFLQPKGLKETDPV